MERLELTARAVIDAAARPPGAVDRPVISMPLSSDSRAISRGSLILLEQVRSALGLLVGRERYAEFLIEFPTILEDAPYKSPKTIVFSRRPWRKAARTAGS